MNKGYIVQIRSRRNTDDVGITFHAENTRGLVRLLEMYKDTDDTYEYRAVDFDDSKRDNPISVEYTQFPIEESLNSLKAQSFVSVNNFFRGSDVSASPRIVARVTEKHSSIHYERMLEDGTVVQENPSVVEKGIVEEI